MGGAGGCQDFSGLALRIMLLQGVAHCTVALLCFVMFVHQLLQQPCQYQPPQCSWRVAGHSVEKRCPLSIVTASLSLYHSLGQEMVRPSGSWEYLLPRQTAGCLSAI